jgi:hypothetical protein
MYSKWLFCAFLLFKDISNTARDVKIEMITFKTIQLKKPSISQLYPSYVKT